MRGSHHRAGVQHAKPRVVQAERPARNAKPPPAFPRITAADQFGQHVALVRDDGRLQRGDRVTCPAGRVGLAIDAAIFGEIDPAFGIAGLQEPPGMTGGGKADHRNALIGHKAQGAIKPDVMQISRIGPGGTGGPFHAAGPCQTPPITVPRAIRR